MIEWLASGIPAAVEASGPRFLPTLLQLLTFIGIAFGAGLFFGRFWLTRIVQNKEAELASEARRYEAQSERLSFLADQVAQFKIEIENVQNLDEAKEAAKEIQPVETEYIGTSKAPRNLNKQNEYRVKLEQLIFEKNVPISQLANEIDIPPDQLLSFLSGYYVSRGPLERIENYLATHNAL